MIKKAITTIEEHNMLNIGDHVVIGLSGGADSVSLLYILTQIKIEYQLKITAVHINHHIRGTEGIRDENFVKKLCQSLDIPLMVENFFVLDLAKELKLTVEETGRMVRYQGFDKALQECGATKIATAHTKTDVVETMLMNFIRGTGIKGIIGIPPVRDNIIRPIIDCTREGIENFCKKHGLEYIIDSSNNCEDYTRNKIRLTLIPFLKKELNPNIVESLGRSANIFATEEKYLTSQVKVAYDECIIQENNEIRLNIKNFLNYDTAIQYRIIRKMFEEKTNNLKNFTNKHVISVVSLIKAGNTGKSINLPQNIVGINAYQYFILKNQETEKTYQYNLEIGSFVAIKEEDFYISCEIEEKSFKKGYINTCTKVFNYDKIHSGLVIRPRQQGDRIFLKNVGTKKIKKFFIDEKIPSFKRDSILLIAMGNDILWIPEKLAVSEDYLANDKCTNKIYIKIWEKVKS